MNEYAKEDAYRKAIQEKMAASQHWSANHDRVAKGLGQGVDAMAGGMVAGGLMLDKTPRQPEVPVLLEQLAREIADAESSFAELRARLSIVTRPEAPEPAPNGNACTPHSVPNTDMGAMVRGMAERVDSLTGSMRSLLRRLEV